MEKFDTATKLTNKEILYLKNQSVKLDQEFVQHLKGEQESLRGAILLEQEIHQWGNRLIGNIHKNQIVENIKDTIYGYYKKILEGAGITIKSKEDLFGGIERIIITTKTQPGIASNPQNTNPNIQQNKDETPNTTTNTNTEERPNIQEQNQINGFRTILGDFGLSAEEVEKFEDDKILILTKKINDIYPTINTEVKTIYENHFQNINFSENIADQIQNNSQFYIDFRKIAVNISTALRDIFDTFKSIIPQNSILQSYLGRVNDFVNQALSQINSIKDLSNDQIYNRLHPILNNNMENIQTIYKNFNKKLTQASNKGNGWLMKFFEEIKHNPKNFLQNLK